MIPIHVWSFEKSTSHPPLLLSPPPPPSPSWEKDTPLIYCPGGTRLYTNLNGLKTIPLPAAHTCIANIWEYPPPQSTVLLFYWLYLSKTPDSLASECCNILDQNNLPFVVGKIHFFPSQRLCRKLIEWLGQGPNMSCTASCAIQCTAKIQSWAFYYSWNGFEHHVYCTYRCN